VLQKKFGFDDCSNVYGVVAVSSFVSTILVALAAHPAFGGNQGNVVIATQVAVQLFSSCVVVAWSLVATFLVVKVTEIVCRGLTVQADPRHGGTDDELVD
jgi:ammonium transporter, Amt family